MEQLPWLLIATRFSIAVFLFFLPLISKNKKSFLFLLLFIPAFATDFLDGFVMRHFARQLLSSHAIGRADSAADALLYLAAFVNVWRLRPNLIKREGILIIIFLFLQLFSWVLALVKYGDVTSYHGQVARICGAFLFLSLIEMTVFNKTRLFRVAFVAGMVYLFKEISITATGM